MSEHWFSNIASEILERTHVNQIPGLGKETLEWTKESIALKKLKFSIDSEVQPTSRTDVNPLENSDGEKA